MRISGSFTVLIVAAALSGHSKLSQAQIPEIFNAQGIFADESLLTGQLLIDVQYGTLLGYDLYITPLLGTAPSSYHFNPLSDYLHDSSPIEALPPLLPHYELFAVTQQIPIDGLPTHTVQAELLLALPVPSLVAYFGSSLITQMDFSSYGRSTFYNTTTFTDPGLVSGSLSPTPEPSGLALATLASLILTGQALRFLRRRGAPHH